MEVTIFELAFLFFNQDLSQIRKASLKGPGKLRSLIIFYSIKWVKLECVRREWADPGKECNGLEYF